MHQRRSRYNRNRLWRGNKCLPQHVHTRPFRSSGQFSIYPVGRLTYVPVSIPRFHAFQLLLRRIKRAIIPCATVQQTGKSPLTGVNCKVGWRHAIPMLSLLQVPVIVTYICGSDGQWSKFLFYSIRHILLILQARTRRRIRGLLQSCYRALLIG